MIKIILSVTGWMLRKLGLLILLVVIMLLVPSIRDAWRVVDEFDPESAVHDAIKQSKFDFLDQKKNTQALKDWRLKLQSDLDQNQIELEALQETRDACILATCTIANNAKIFRTVAEKEVLSQALSYSDAVVYGAQTCKDLKNNQPVVTSLRENVQELNKSWLGWGRIFPSESHQLLINKLAELEIKQNRLLISCQFYNGISSKLQIDENFIKKKLKANNVPFLLEIEKIKKFKQKALGQIIAVLPSAICIMLGLIFMPIGFKLFAYYVTAPLAARFFEIQLIPSDSGMINILSSSDYLQRISLNKGEEFLFRPELFRSAPINSHKSTKYVLDVSMPLTSVGCGLYFLTRIKSDAECIVEIGGENAYDGGGIKYLVLEVPEYSSIVLKPHCLVGIIQDINKPIRISKHWMLSSVPSWLTFQLRYIAFHGPAKLVLSGNNGISVVSCDAATSLSQRATLGFSANLNYSICRSETLYSYYSGKSELLNDRFSGLGIILHEIGLPKNPKSPLRRFSYPFELLWDVITKSVGL
jgi:hypothetical protein